MRTKLLFKPFKYYKNLIFHPSKTKQQTGHGHGQEKQAGENKAFLGVSNCFLFNLEKNDNIDIKINS